MPEHEKVTGVSRVPDAIKKLAMRAANGYGAAYMGNLVLMRIPDTETDPLLHGVDRVWLLFDPPAKEKGDIDDGL